MKIAKSRKRKHINLPLNSTFDAPTGIIFDVEMRKGYYGLFECGTSEIADRLDSDEITGAYYPSAIAHSLYFSNRLNTVIEYDAPISGGDRPEDF